MPRGALFLLFSTLVACGADTFVGSDGSLPEGATDGSPGADGRTGFCAAKVIDKGWCEDFDGTPPYGSAWTKVQNGGMVVINPSATAPSPANALTVTQDNNQMREGLFRNTGLSHKSKLSFLFNPMGNFNGADIVSVQVTNNYGFALRLGMNGPALIELRSGITMPNVTVLQQLTPPSFGAWTPVELLLNVELVPFQGSVTITIGTSIQTVMLGQAVAIRPIATDAPATGLEIGMSTATGGSGGSVSFDNVVYVNQ